MIPEFCHIGFYLRNRNIVESEMDRVTKLQEQITAMIHEYYKKEFKPVEYKKDGKLVKEITMPQSNKEKAQAYCDVKNIILASNDDLLLQLIKLFDDLDFTRAYLKNDRQCNCYEFNAVFDGIKHLSGYGDELMKLVMFVNCKILSKDKTEDIDSDMEFW